MFTLSEKNEVIRKILKFDSVCYSRSELSTINTANSEICIKKPTEDSAFCLLNSYHDLNFDVIHAISHDRYADGEDIRLISLGPIALLISYKLTTSSGKHLKDFSFAHIVSSMYKLTNSSRDSDDLSIF